jgi:hypothetical protein
VKRIMEVFGHILLNLNSSWVKFVSLLKPVRDLRGKF